jgi:hypothetical protein
MHRDAFHLCERPPPIAAGAATKVPVILSAAKDLDVLTRIFAIVIGEMLHYVQHDNAL